MNFGELYASMFKLVLTTVNEKNCKNFQELLNEINENKTALQLVEKLGDDKSVTFIEDILKEQINIGLIVGFSKEFRTLGGSGMIFNIERLSPTGYMYLDEVSKPNFWDKFKSYAKENGMVPTPENITKFIANSLWD